MERQAEPLAPDGTAGRTVKCPKCGTGISMPEARARVTGTPPAQLDRSDKQSPAGAGPPDYPAMKREAAVVTLRQGARKVCDSARFGPSTAGRLCFALLLGAVLFGGALVLSFAPWDPRGGGRHPRLFDFRRCPCHLLVFDFGTERQLARVASDTAQSNADFREGEIIHIFGVCELAAQSAIVEVQAIIPQPWDRRAVSGERRFT